VIRESVYRLHRGPELPKITYQIWAGEVAPVGQAERN